MDTIGPYRIVDGPFHGGFAEVYRVFDTDSGDEFALKTTRASLLPDSPGLARFRAEVAVWIAIPTHPNVVRAIRAFEHNGRSYVLIEWLGAGDLAANRGLLLPEREPERTLHGAYRHIEVMRQLCAGVAHIHAQGFVHGDIKPGNVMLWAGLSPQVTDFGLARVVDSVVAAGAGTRRYMAPELHDRGESSPAVDVYSVGVVFQELLTEVGEHAAGVAAAAPIAAAMVERDPRNRPHALAEIAAELATIVERSPIPPGVPERGGERLTWDEQHAHVLPARTHYGHALTAYTAGHLSEALQHLESALAIEPARLDALQLLATIDPTRSERLRDVDLEAVTNARALVALTHLWLHAARPDEAARVVDRLAELGSSPAEVAFLRGWIAGMNGLVSDEIDHYRDALALGGDADVRFRLAQALKDSGLVDEALRELDAISPDDPLLGTRALAVKARMCVDTGRLRDAKILLRDALQRDNSVEHAVYLYCEQGYVLRTEGLYDAARRSYEMALALDRDCVAARDGLDLVRTECLE